MVWRQNTFCFTTSFTTSIVLQNQFRYLISSPIEISRVHLSGFCVVRTYQLQNDAFRLKFGERVDVWCINWFN